MKVTYLNSRSGSLAIVGRQPRVPFVVPKPDNGQDEHDAVEAENSENRNVKVNLKMLNVLF